jgi:hypothetical protein
MWQFLWGLQCEMVLCHRLDETQSAGRKTIQVARSLADSDHCNGAFSPLLLRGECGTIMEPHNALS